MFQIYFHVVKLIFIESGVSVVNVGFYGTVLSELPPDLRVNVRSGRTSFRTWQVLIITDSAESTRIKYEKPHSRWLSEQLPIIREYLRSAISEILRSSIYSNPISIIIEFTRPLVSKITRLSLAQNVLFKFKICTLVLLCTQALSENQSVLPGSNLSLYFQKLSPSWWEVHRPTLTRHRSVSVDVSWRKQSQYDRPEFILLIILNVLLYVRIMLFLIFEHLKMIFSELI